MERNEARHFGGVSNHTPWVKQSLSETSSKVNLIEKVEASSRGFLQLSLLTSLNLSKAPYSVKI